MTRFVIKLVSSALPLAAVILLLVQLVISNRLVSAGKNTLSLDQEIAVVHADNEQLQQAIATATSLTVLERKATELGFTRTTHAVVLTPPDVAYNRTQ